MLDICYRNYFGIVIFVFPDSCTQSKLSYLIIKLNILLFISTPTLMPFEDIGSCGYIRSPLR